MFGIVFLWHHPSSHKHWWGGHGLVISIWSRICWQPAPTRKDHWDWMLLRGTSGCRWTRYPCKENSPSASKFLLWWFIPENWDGQKCSHETSFLKPGLFCWTCAEHSWLSLVPEEESLRKSTCTPGRSLPGQEKHSVHKSWLPSRCTWWICPKARDAGALQLPTEADKLWHEFHWEAAAGSGELLASWKLLSFQKTWKRFLFNLDKTQILYIYI